MPTLRWLAVPFILGIFSLLTVGYLNTFTPVKIVDGDTVTDLRTHQSTVEGVLREIGVTLQPEDAVLPGLSSSLNRNDTIVVKRATLVKVVVDGSEPKLVRTQRTSSRAVLADLGYSVSVQDALSVNNGFGDQLLQQSNTGATASIELQFRPAVSVAMTDDAGKRTPFQTSAKTVGEALLQAGVIVYLADRVQPSLGEAVKPGVEISIKRAKPVSIWVDGRQVRTRTLSNRVGDVLAEMKIVLFEQDYTKPDLDAEIAPNSEIRVVRIKREVQIQQQFLPFETLTQPDDALEIDTQILAQDGAPGVREQRNLVTFEDGLEVKREQTADFTAREPQPRIYKYGTNIVVRTLDTPSGPVQYWRKIRMLATSYSSSTAGVTRDKAWYGKARCGVAMRFGIVAVDPRVVSLGTNVYVNGYGVGNACDTGSAIIGKRIDLGYDDSNLDYWYKWVDVYVLTPPPANITYRLE